MKDIKQCPFCSEDIKQGAIKCKHCGSNLSAPKTGKQSTNKRKGVAGTLAILFGGIGIHKFYLEQYGKGTLYVCFFWTAIPLIFGIIDGIKFFSMKEEDWDKTYNKSI